MPGKVWYKDSNGHLTGVLIAGDNTRPNIVEIELANALDRKLDNVLDEAFIRHSQLSNPDIVHTRFTSAWVVGEVFSRSAVVFDKALASEDSKFLWNILSQKSSACARSDGSNERNWRTLRPSDTSQDRGMDYWEMCLWLAEQEYARAVRTFGGSIKNVWSLLGTPTLKPLVLREALCDCLDGLDEEIRQKIFKVLTYRKMLKQLRHKWPARGTRSALQPIHYSQEDLAEVLAKTIDLVEILGEEKVVSK